MGGKANPVPVLPDKITYTNLINCPIEINSIPIGIVKKDLSYGKLNLEDNVGYIISGRNYDDIVPFIDRLLYILSLSKNFNSYVFDSKYTFEENKYNRINYINNNFDNYLKQLYDYSNSIYDIYNKNNSNKRSIKDKTKLVVVILGLDKFYNGLSAESKKVFENILSQNKEIGVVNFIYIDTPSALKKNEYNAWYKDSVDNTSGLWIGDGFSEQNVIKISRLDKSYSLIIGNKYGYITEVGTPKFVKLIEKE